EVAVRIDAGTAGGGRVDRARERKDLNGTECGDQDKKKRKFRNSHGRSPLLLLVVEHEQHASSGAGPPSMERSIFVGFRYRPAGGIREVLIKDVGPPSGGPTCPLSLPSQRAVEICGGPVRSFAARGCCELRTRYGLGGRGTIRAKVDFGSIERYRSIGLIRRFTRPEHPPA